ncbi:PhzF family phenazine biosynthesis protein [Planomonospora venezuelensis]|uniref:PhzF family phenazine biosynthesis protein n=1 Tax=Planomonospora venezuelensis TaxID=1999 RepID=A0A841D9D6_PLAVE|nr:PhzF family phenazine biosynthesis protein [Planomonospora venezuelensis]MBB5965227.1 PhzF family phenazine biosynthesis protein [Planomonospora venezuelensis]
MQIFTVDAFTDSSFRGNPAGVCLLDAPVPDSWMRSLAAEMRHSETAFLLREENGGPHSLRWFTPVVEVALCGHATLSTAHVLYSTGAASGVIEFSTRSGILSVVRDDTTGLISMDFPAKVLEKTDPPQGLIEALGVEPVWVGRNEWDYLVEVGHEDAVRAVSPDFAALESVDARGVIVTAGSAAEGADYVSRFFAPRVGVPEDPVTGSAHCALGPYWTARLGGETLTGYQCSERGGTVRTTVRGDRVELAGHAVTVLSGELHV